MSKKTAAEIDEANAAALLARLQAQFGDMNVNKLISAGCGDDDGNAPQDVKDTVVINSTDNADDSVEVYTAESEDEESSIEEASPEEVLRWQQAQYKLAAWGKGQTADIDNENGEEAQSNEEITNWVCEEGPADLDGQESAFFCSDSANPDPILASLCSQEGALGGKWKRLYSSNVDGLSYAGLVSSVRGYDGPTVFMLGAVPPPPPYKAKQEDKRNVKSAILGFYTSTPWRESMKYYGRKDCFLFRVNENECTEDSSPLQVQLYRPIETTESPPDELASNATKSKQKKALYQFCHSTTAAAIASNGRKPGQYYPNDVATDVTAPPGFGAGGQQGGPGPRLHITETLLNCTALSHDGTFGAGSLLPPSFTDHYPNAHTFDMDAMEVWGVGGAQHIKQALQAQSTHRSLKESSRKKNATVDRMQFVDHFKNSDFSKHSKAFAGDQYTSGGTD